ncbi:hypothetical protein ASPWEDRAFT_170547 [Aspergillus wentii DTO 134E9]|uniref:cystathionine gamma-lyase n=1 Tax=Aspergillus wentii DTO 134E9 TaxID=1073089 RepID=A0A1L9RQ85_ASPWE|nr:uncharacterized protein ASPWEDRAFT_170547 [Aspergillus wentii DTO 134E9]OJJ37052.1 hypothetical protein ASPWEDRAFT_170547 [Aspergillus wentii DTO 134E9]
MYGFGTSAVRSGLPRDATTGALVETISLSTIFAQQHPASPVGSYVYSRSANPNRESFEKAIADLESARYALAFSSGMAATDAVVLGLAAHSHTVSMSSLYGGTHRYLTQVAPLMGVMVSFASNIETELEALINEKTKLVVIESPSNPMVDIQAVADIAHKLGALNPTSARPCYIAKCINSRPNPRGIARPIAVKQHRNEHGGSRLFTLAESLGGVESLCKIPAVMTHKRMPREVREEGGIYIDLIRLSGGIEDVKDLKDDLARALEMAVSG